MEKGFLTLEIKGHKQPKELQYKAKKLNDNQWHHVELEKNEKHIRLEVIFIQKIFTIFGLGTIFLIDWFFFCKLLKYSLAEAIKETFL